MQKHNALVVALFVVACGKGPQYSRMSAPSGASSAPLVQLPFAAATSHRCPQGEESEHEHVGPARYGIDFAARAADEAVLAPVAGTLYRHGADDSVGTHVNIALSDGRYVTVGFMKSIAVGDGEEVAVGQVIGVSGALHEGDLGVHLALFAGNAASTSGNGTPLPLTRLMTRDRSRGGAFSEHRGIELVCGREGDLIVGHEYEALNLAALRHLPGTLVKTAAAPAVYLIKSASIRAHIANETVFRASGFTDAQIIIVSEDELNCYSEGAEVTRAVSIPAAPRLRDGTLVKESGKSAVYAVSGGIAWPIKYWEVFLLAGYNVSQVVEIPDGMLAGRVKSVGNCETGDHCLDTDYLTECGNDPSDDEEEPTATPADGGTSISTVPDAGVPPAPPEAGTDPDPTSIPTQSGGSSGASSGSGGINGISGTGGTSSGSGGAQPIVLGTGGVSGSGGVFGTGGATFSSGGSWGYGSGGMVGTGGAIASSGGASGVPDFSWVYRADGSAVCLNALYFAGGTRAVLLIWTGPGTDGTKGPVANETNGRFCWDFAGKPKGLYSFWADEPVEGCTNTVCGRDMVENNGAQYMTAPKVVGAERKWLHCEPTGCDGMGYWDGTSWTPAGE